MLRKYLLILVSWLGLSAAQATPLTQVQAVPDVPQAFGFKTQWLAVKTTSPQAVLALLPLHNIQPANWQSGLNAVAQADYRSDTQPVVITPAVNGWVFVVCSMSIPALDTDSGWQQLNAFTAPLLKQFGEVQYFGSYRVTNYVAWAKAEKGQWIRRFAWSDGQITELYGQQTDAEKMLKLPDIRSNEDLADERLFEQWLASFDEETPHKLAGFWGIDPEKLPKMGLLPSTGWLADVKIKP